MTLQVLYENAAAVIIDWSKRDRGSQCQLVSATHSRQHDCTAYHLTDLLVLLASSQHTTTITYVNVSVLHALVVVVCDNDDKQYTLTTLMITVKGSVFTMALNYEIRLDGTFLCKTAPYRNSLTYLLT